MLEVLYKKTKFITKEFIEVFTDFVRVVWYQMQMSGCVLAHVLRYITPNCISEAQSTVKWKVEHTNLSAHCLCNY
jgi:hypothetical protein